jgi:hypothetical protein
MSTIYVVRLPNDDSPDKYQINKDTGEIKQTEPSERVIYRKNKDGEPDTIANDVPNATEIIRLVRARAGGGGIFTETEVQRIDPNAVKPTFPKIEADFSAKLKSQNLKYPKDMNLNQVYIEFKSYDFSDVSETKEAYSVFAGGELKLKIQQEALKLFSFSNTPMVVAYNKDRIQIYAPQDINTEYGANWGEASLSLFGNQASTNNPLVNFLGSAPSSAMNILGGMALRTALNEISKYIPQFKLNEEQAFGLATGLVTNRNELSTFTNINRRKFDYTFNFFAKNKKEHDEIQKIINTFKVALHPIGSAAGNTTEVSVIGVQQTRAYARSPILKYPKIWTIAYMVNGEPVKDIPRTKFCALTNVKVNYTPNNTLTVVGETYNEIPAINMSLSFLELTPLTGDQIINPGVLGYPDKNIGGINENAETVNGGAF